ncbi:hypothetical protein MLD38_014432 [Melastoma candidum]|uniref:Uncharacterized protein n=1 Tax=Melastoma candidum TaxID=119954 RepID=A0ACB9RGX4_9MYRT|nr:hypothetical protein MLD38_014432 [Melastoma candidum]
MGWRYRGGLILISAVVILWVTSAEVTQGVLEDYNQPFVVTYVATSMMLAYLPISFLKDCLFGFLKSRYFGRNCEGSDDVDEPSDDHKSSALQDRHDQPGKGIESDGVNSLEEGKCIRIEPENIEVANGKTNHESMLQIFKVASTVGPIWFVSQYSMSAALARTSVASATIWFSTSGLFTLLIGAALRQDSINLVKVASVLLSVGGVALTAVGKTSAKEPSSQTNTNLDYSLLGNLLALVSAASDGLFGVLLRKFFVEGGEKIDMQKLLGCMGFLSLSSLWWLVWPLMALGLEPKFAFPKSARVGEVAFANCIFQSFVSEYIWALVIVWTTPLVASLGESLTIPVAMVEDMLIHGRSFSPLYIFGSVLVFCGFILANSSEWFCRQYAFMQKLWRNRA